MKFNFIRGNQETSDINQANNDGTNKFVRKAAPSELVIFQLPQKKKLKRAELVPSTGP
jgi:hypothetical protein